VRTASQLNNNTRINVKTTPAVPALGERTRGLAGVGLPRGFVRNLYVTKKLISVMIPNEL
jgi:hypothetical protein